MNSLPRSDDVLLPGLLRSGDDAAETERSRLTLIRSKPSPLLVEAFHTMSQSRVYDVLLQLNRLQMSQSRITLLIITRGMD
jgi:hypothetical protein